MAVIGVLGGRRPWGMLTMGKAFVAILFGVALFMGASVYVFHRSPNLSWPDAVYFTVTTMTTVGYGDISCSEAPLFVKVFGMGTMIGGSKTGCGQGIL